MVDATKCRSNATNYSIWHNSRPHRSVRMASHAAVVADLGCLMGFRIQVQLRRAVLIANQRVSLLLG
jgi:hypothetical protein